jgi:NCS2 family nucleobase:cation symporter-2
VTLIQSFGMTSWFGIKLPVMMGVTFAAVGPMVAIANAVPGIEGARAIFGAGIGAGVLALLMAPLMSRMLRFFPPVVTGSIILVIGVTLMRVGVSWAMGGPDSASQTVDVAKLAAMVEEAKAGAALAVASLPAGAAAPVLKLAGPVPMNPNPAYGALDDMAIAGFVLLVVLGLVKYVRGFLSNISVLVGILAGCTIAFAAGKMNFAKLDKAAWFDVVTPFAFGMPTFDIVMILTLTVVMVVVMIESAGMFLALSDMTGKQIDQKQLAAGLRTDGLGTLIGGILNTFPHTSFSQNVGLVAVTGVKSRWVCVAGGIIMIVLGMLPKMAALVEAIPQFVLGGAGLVMFGMVAAAGIRILTRVDFKANRFNLYIVAMSIGFGLIPLVAPHWAARMAHSLHPLLESGILLTAVAAVVLNLFFNGARDVPAESHDEACAVEHPMAQGGAA